MIKTTFGCPLTEDSPIKPKIPKPIAEGLKALAAAADAVAAANAASSSNNADSKDDLWKNIPLPSIADTSEQQLMTPKTLLDCCQCAKEFTHEYDLSDAVRTVVFQWGSYVSLELSPRLSPGLQGIALRVPSQGCSNKRSNNALSQTAVLEEASCLHRPDRGQSLKAMCRLPSLEVDQRRTKSTQRGGGNHHDQGAGRSWFHNISPSTMTHGQSSSC